MIPVDLTYSLPSAIYLLPFVFLLLLLFWKLYLYRSRNEVLLGNKEVLSVILKSRSPTIFWIKSAAVTLLWAGAVLALMDPKGNARYPEEEIQKHKTSLPAEMSRPAQDIFLLVDASASMDVKDSRDGTSRLSYAKDIADQIVSQLNGQNVSLLAFTSELTPLSPLTLDYLFVRLMIGQMQINEGNISGTDFKAALEEMIHTYLTGPSARQRILVWFTDGGDTLYETLGGAEKMQRQKEILSLLDTLEQDQVDVFVVGMGSLQGGEVPDVTYKGERVHSPLEETFLRQLARHGGGNYYEANAYSSIEIAEDILKNLRKEKLYPEKSLIPNAAAQTGQFKVYDYYYQIPLGIALLLLLFILLFPETKKQTNSLFVSLFFILFLSKAEAQTIEGDMRKASIYYEAEDYSKAAEIYQDLLNQPLTDEQQAIILYDLGSVYLASGQNLKALVLFNSIYPDKEPQELFQRELKTNQALAYLKESLLIKGNSFDPLAEKFFYLQESLQAIHSAKRADCEFKQAEGYSTCENSGNLILMEKAIHHYISELKGQINEFKKNIPATNFKSPLQRLMFSYKILLIEEEISAEPLSRLQKEQQSIGGNLNENEKKVWEDSNAWLNKSMGSLPQNTPVARLYLLKAYHELVLLQRLSEPESQTAPKRILDDSIEDQREALYMSRLLYKIQEAQANFTFENPQDFVLETAKAFFPAVKEYQSKQFINKGNKTPEECCQARPWDEILPLFNRGWKEAWQAGQETGLKRLIAQEQALSTWLETKEKLNAPIKPFSGSCFGKNAMKPSGESKNETSFENLARELEKMSKADSSLQQAPSPPIQVERPW